MKTFEGNWENSISKDSASRAEKGEYVVCITDKLKHYEKGNVYEVKDAKTEKHYIGTRKIKLVGFTSHTSVSNFRMAHENELRDITINRLLDLGSDNKESVGRKIDRVSNKNYTLMELLINRITRDKNYLSGKYSYNTYNDFDSMVKTIVKGDTKYDVKEDDFKSLMEISAAEMFDLFIKERIKEKETI